MMDLLPLSSETLWVFILTSGALALSPGPDNIFVMTQSALHGRRAGLWVMSGLCSGLVLHTLIVAIGVATIFATSVMAFTLLKFVGAAYLLFLAWQAYRAGKKAGAMGMGDGSEDAISYRKVFARGVITNITNPKVAIFFMAFLPQFADPAQGSLTVQLIALGAVFILCTILVFSVIACISGDLGNRLRTSSRAHQFLHRFSATVFTALAVNLAFASR